MFIFFKIIFDLFLILSLYIILLGLIFTNNVFLALSFILIKKISKLNILPSYKQLFLYLKLEIANISVFYKSIRMFYNQEILSNQPLLYTTLLKWIKWLSILTRFLQIMCLYYLQYSIDNAFNQSSIYYMILFL